MPSKLAERLDFIEQDPEVDRRTIQAVRGVAALIRPDPLKNALACSSEDGCSLEWGKYGLFYHAYPSPESESNEELDHCIYWSPVNDDLSRGGDMIEIKDVKEAALRLNKILEEEVPKSMINLAKRLDVTEK